MQLVYTFFYWWLFWSIKLISELKIINNILDFNLNHNKIALKFQNLETLNTTNIYKLNSNLLSSKVKEIKNIKSLKIIKVTII